jgi:hypothetical protein
MRNIDNALFNFTGILKAKKWKHYEEEYVLLATARKYKK